MARATLAALRAWVEAGGHASGLPHPDDHMCSRCGVVGHLARGLCGLCLAATAEPGPRSASAYGHLCARLDRRHAPPAPLVPYQATGDEGRDPWDDHGE